MEIMGGSRDVYCNVNVRIRYNSSANSECARCPVAPFLLARIPSPCGFHLAGDLSGTFLLVLVGGAVSPMTCESAQAPERGAIQLARPLVQRW